MLGLKEDVRAGSGKASGTWKVCNRHSRHRSNALCNFWSHIRSSHQFIKRLKHWNNSKLEHWSLHHSTVYGEFDADQLGSSVTRFELHKDGLYPQQWEHEYDIVHINFQLESCSCRDVARFELELRRGNHSSGSGTGRYLEARDTVKRLGYPKLQLQHHSLRKRMILHSYHFLAKKIVALETLCRNARRALLSTLIRTV
jgi:hypothetical protein